MLLCESLEGYHNLIKLVSSGFLEGFYYKPRIDLRPAFQAQQGIDRAVGVSARAGDRSVVEEKYDLARENAYRLRDVFGKEQFLSGDSGSGPGD